MTESTEAALGARKMVGFMSIPTDLLIETALKSCLVGEQTDEEREDNRRRAAQARLDARNDWTATRNHYAAIPALLAVLDLHQPKDDDHGWPECSYAESEEYATEWPCETYTAIKEA